MLREFQARLLVNSGWAGDPQWRALLKKGFWIALALHLGAAVFSEGFYAPDEHFQILEFAKNKLDGIQGDQPQEFGLALRSWLQPAIFVQLVRVARAVGVENPFHQAMAFRLLSALFGLLATFALLVAAYPWLKTQLQRKVAVGAAALLWYLPALHARTSSENASGAVFFLGLALLVLLRGKEEDRLAPVVFAVGGFLCGTAFELRFQTAFLSLGLLAWWACVGKAGPKELLSFVLAGILPLGLGALVNRWGYGYWTFPAWNYLNFTLVQDHVNDVTTGPLWDYVRVSFTEACMGLGTLLFAGFLVFCYRNPKNPITWAGVPFLLVHHLIRHKELRFLFPLAHAGPVFLALALGEAEKPRWRWVAYAALAYNLLALPLQSFAPAYPRMALFRAIYESGIQSVYYTYDVDDPYSIQGIRIRFYRRPTVMTERVPPDSQLISHAGPFGLYYVKGRQGPSPALLAHRKCYPLVSQLPVTIESLIPRDRFPNVKNWQYLECQ